MSTEVAYPSPILLEIFLALLVRHIGLGSVVYRKKVGTVNPHQIPELLARRARVISEGVIQ